jgi:hypothetical protein
MGNAPSNAGTKHLGADSLKAAKPTEFFNSVAAESRAETLANFATICEPERNEQRPKGDGRGPQLRRFIGETIYFWVR